MQTQVMFSSPGSMTTAERQAHHQTWLLRVWQGGSCLVHTGLTPLLTTKGQRNLDSQACPAALLLLSSCLPDHCRLLQLPSLRFQCAVPDPHTLPWAGALLCNTSTPMAGHQSYPRYVGKGRAGCGLANENSVCTAKSFCLRSHKARGARRVQLSAELQAPTSQPKLPGWVNSTAAMLGASDLRAGLGWCWGK